MAFYTCKHCGKKIRRRSNKKWIRSYCESTGRTVRLIRIR